MNKPPDDLESRLRRQPRASVPGHLKSRVMTTAVLASPPASWGDRVWFSMTWRLVAAGTLLALLGVDRWTGAWSAVAGSAPAAPAVAEVEAVAALSGEIGLSPEQVRRLAARVEFVNLTAPEPRGKVESALQ